MRIKSNWKSEVKPFYDRAIGPGAGRQRHTLVVANNAEYALPLHVRDGFSVLSPGHIRQFALKWLAEMLTRHGLPTKRAIEQALTAAGIESVNFHRSLGSRLRPPARAGGSPRRAHVAPLNWADITGLLAASYFFTVNGKAHGSGLGDPSGNPDGGAP